jgi:hypothetical protein
MTASLSHGNIAQEIFEQSTEAPVKTLSDADWVSA